MTFFQIIKPSGGGEAAWEYLNPLSPDGSSDPNSIVSGLSYNAGTGVISLTVDKNKAAGYDAPGEAAAYWWDTGLTAADDFMPMFNIISNNFATMDNTDVVIHVGLTSDPTDLANYTMSAGIDFRVANARPIRYSNTTSATTAGLATTQNVATSILRWGSTNANSGNVGSNVYVKGCNSSNEGENIDLALSASRVTANASTDSLYVVLFVGFTINAAATVDCEFKVAQAPITANTL